MQNFDMRSRAALIVLVAVLLVGLVGWTFSRNGSNQETMLPLTPPPAGSLEIPAEGEDVKESSGADTQAEAAIPSVPEKSAKAKEEEVPAASVVVHVSGAVKRPNVYTLKSGDRIYQAIRAAGGFKKNALQDALNLADKVQDGDQINVPSRSAARSPQAASPPLPAVRRSVSAPPSPAAAAAAPRMAPVKRGRVLGKAASSPTALTYTSPSAGDSSGGGDAPAASPSGKLKTPGDGTVNINTADATELQRLPGVGPAMSERILQLRQEIGRFQSAEQLMDVKGIGEKKFGKMQPFVVVK